MKFKKLNSLYHIKTQTLYQLQNQRKQETQLLHTKNATENLSEALFKPSKSSHISIHMQSYKSSLPQSDVGDDL